MIERPLVLASSSPRRKYLLNQIGMNFIVVPSNVDENFNLSLPPNAFTEHWAREKAKHIAKRYPDNIVLGADTVVILENKILGKPKDTEESFNMLSSLSGKTHEVITGLSIIYKKENIDITFNQKTYVSIKTLSNDKIYDYMNTYNPFDKAGSYGIQDGFSVYINKIEGCFFNVMGLPLSTFKEYYDSIKRFDI
jgi:septum formation protein